MNNNTSFIYLIILNTLPWEKKKTKKQKQARQKKNQQKRMYKL